MCALAVYVISKYMEGHIVIVGLDWTELDLDWTELDLDWT